MGVLSLPRTQLYARQAHNIHLAVPNHQDGLLDNEVPLPTLPPSIESQLPLSRYAQTLEVLRDGRARQLSEAERLSFMRIHRGHGPPAVHPHRHHTAPNSTGVFDQRQLSIFSSLRRQRHGLGQGRHTPSMPQFSIPPHSFGTQSTTKESTKNLPNPTFPYPAILAIHI